MGGRRHASEHPTADAAGAHGRGRRRCRPGGGDRRVGAGPSGDIAGRCRRVRKYSDAAASGDAGLGVDAARAVRRDRCGPAAGLAGRSPIAGRAVSGCGRPRPAMITVAGVFCLYGVPGGATVAALRGLSLRVPAGERLVVHGPNGSGKTTLLRVLTGEVAASSGSVTVAGLQLAGAGAARIATLRRNVLGLIDQHSGRALRAELSVLDNVALQLRLSGHSRTDALAAAQHTIGALGLSSLAGRRPPTLSAGE